MSTTNPQSLAYEGILLTTSLQIGLESRAVALLNHYFRPLAGKNDGFTGGAWDAFDPSGTRGQSGDVFTSDDVLSLSLLSIQIYGRAAFDILVTRKNELNDKLRALGPDRDFATLPSANGSDFAPVRSLYRALVDLPEVGEVTATKLIARKRPRMVPIMDSVVKRAIFSDTPFQWESLHKALGADNRKLHKHLLKLHCAANLSASVSPLRVFDVLAWMDGSGNAAKYLRDQASREKARPAMSPPT